MSLPLHSIIAWVGHNEAVFGFFLLTYPGVVLTTKDLLGVKQEEPYDIVEIVVK